MMPDLAHQQNSQTSLTVELIDPRKLVPSPENDRVYRPVNREDPTIKQLAQDIREKGVQEPLVITLDHYVLSGHRRREAAIIAGLPFVPCRIQSIRHDDPQFMSLLVSFNNQRVKNGAELLREAVVNTNPHEAYKALLDYRNRQCVVKAETIKVDARPQRKKVSDVKAEMVDAAIQVVNENRRFWPLSDRQIHYRLLNNPPLRNTRKRKSHYQNDRASYQDLCNLLTRLRLTGKIPMEAIDDTTRSTTDWYVHASPQDFAQQELDDFLKGYRRDLQQSQPLHLEIIAEKLTVETIIRPVCGRYNIPYTIGRGYSSLPARHKIVQRFKASGKDKLLLLVLSDFDADGIVIGECLLQSLRQDFGVVADAVRVGLTPEQIERFQLVNDFAKPKKTSPQYKKFAEKYGVRTKVYELEALTPDQLKVILQETIDRVIDIDAFNDELGAETEDARYLEALRKQVCSCVTDLLDEDLDADE